MIQDRAGEVEGLCLQCFALLYRPIKLQRENIEETRMHGRERRSNACLGKKKHDYRLCCSLLFSFHDRGGWGEL